MGTLVTDAIFYSVPTEDGGSLQLTVTQPHDPAYALLQNPNIFSTPNDDIYRDNCYICRDPEFAQRGMPLCKPCEACGGHVAADDTVCDDCGADAQELYYDRLAAECEAEGHAWVTRLPTKWDPQPNVRCEHCGRPWEN